MSILDDPALILGPVKAPLAAAVEDGTWTNVQLRAGSEFARDFNIPVSAIGTVFSTYDQEGERRAVVDFGPGRFVTGVPASELRRASTEL